MVVVRAKRSQLAYFRARARHTPKEIHAYLIGKVVSPKLVVVTKFAYPGARGIYASGSTT
jgi:hypothetical protein